MSRLTQALERAKAGGGAALVTEAAAVPDASYESPALLAEDQPTDPTPGGWHLHADRPEAERITLKIEDRVPAALQDKVVVGPKADRAMVEQYRQLAALLHRLQARDGAHSVMIASAVAGEGKTMTATNLSLTLSQSYQRRVLLIDADLRSPSIHRVFQLPNSVGLGHVVKGTQGGALPIHWLSPTLAVLTGGEADSDPMSGLVSKAMKQLLAEAAEQFDWVIVDTPPVALMSDAKLLAAMVDATLVVVSANTTPYPLVKRATEAIGDKVLGIVLNRVEKSEVAGGGYGSYGYGYGYANRYGRERAKGA